MPGDDAPDLATAGRRLRVKVLLALILASGIPILVLAYVARGVLDEFKHGFRQLSNAAGDFR